MAITWKITNILYEAQTGEFSDVATEIHWFASDTNGTGHGAAYGREKLDTSNLNSETFVEFNSLSQSQVLTFLHNALGDHKTELENGIQQAIDDGWSETKSGLPSSW